MLKKSDLIYLTIVFFLMRHFKLFNKINTFKKTKDLSYSVGIKFSALMIITYVFKTVVIYLLKKLNLIKFLPNILKNDIIEGHESGCVIVYGEPGEPLNTWQVATINETENVNLNHCYFNVETNSWDSNPNNVTTTDTTNCMCQSGTHRHQVDDPLGPGTAERPIIDIGLGQATVPEDPGTDVAGATVTPPTCVPPADITSFNIQDPPSDADLTIDNFNVTLQCADGFTGTATATACSADGEEYTITSDCAAEPTGPEPFVVYPADLVPGAPNYTCENVCADRGLTCVNSLGAGNSFQSENEPGTDAYANDVKNYILSQPPENINPIITEALTTRPELLIQEWWDPALGARRVVGGWTEVVARGWRSGSTTIGQFLNELPDGYCTDPDRPQELTGNSNQYLQTACFCQP